MAKQVLRGVIGDRASTVEKDAKDPKSALQEWAQAQGQPPPLYVEVSREGPSHAPLFEIEARLASGQTARAKGGSKREVEKTAAKALLDRVADT